jgi:serine/threonine protein kinase
MTRTPGALPTRFPQLPGYAIVEQLYAGSRTEVYRAIEEANQRPVVIKLLKQDYPSFNELLQFRNQYTMTSNLNVSC